MHHQSSLLASVPGLVHGFGCRQQPIPPPFQSFWPDQFPVWKQVHGARLVEVRGPRELAGECDGLYTRQRHQPIGVIGADCTPILLAREDGALVAAVHAGWRGTQARILEALMAQLRSVGEQPQRYLAAIGPVIGPCCYEVSPELAQQFAREFAALGAEVAVPRYRHLNLAAINAWQLRVSGVERVDCWAPCTRCTRDAQGEPIFASYRREGRGPQQYSMIAGS